MYIICVLQNCTEPAFTGRCDTPRGHWRSPLTDTDVEEKFRANTAVLTSYNRDKLVDYVREMSASLPASSLSSLLYSSDMREE